MPFSVVVAGAGTCTSEAHNQVQIVEVFLRFQLHARLSEALGQNWQKDRVHSKVRAVWRSKQAEARVGHSCNLLDFATFGELRDILLRADVWDPYFAADVQMSKAEMGIALERLMEIRHAVDHSRPLSKRHFIWCFCEVDRILQAFGIAADDEPPPMNG